MLEIDNLKTKEKQQRKVLQDLGVDWKGPLSAEFVKSTYDIAHDYRQDMQKNADGYEKTIYDYQNPEAQNLVAGEARRYRKEGKAVLDSTVHDIQSYVKKNNGYYHEQARADMEADLAKRQSDPEIQSTIDDIRNLPESQGPNN